jgi:hypothetical protein
MPKDEIIARKNEEIYTDPQLNQLRRDERGVHDEGWIKALLLHGAYGTLATAAGEQPFLNAHNYVYDEAGHCIYFHRASTGRTSANLEHNPRVCYQVVEMGRMYVSSEPLNFSVEYRSVIVFGTAHRVGEEEASRALRLLLVKYAPHLEFGVDYPASAAQCPSAAVYRVDIESWSGKMNQVAADHPGAYVFK